MAAGLGAFALGPLGPARSVVFVAALVPFNLWLLPRLFGGRALRAGEASGRWRTGLVYYPLVVLALVVVFHRRLEVAAAAWGVLAFGDGVAGLAGRAWGRARLPWNRAKSWMGLVAGTLAGAAAATVLLAWTEPGRHEVGFCVVAGLVAGLYGALLESQPLALDDNLRVPPLVALALLAMVAVGDGGGVALLTRAATRDLVFWLLVGGIAAGVALASRAVRPSGAVAGALLVGALGVGLGVPGVALFGLFFVTGSAVTRLGWRTKRRLDAAEERGGRRGAPNALANAGVAAFLALLCRAAPESTLLPVAFVGALAAALADTLESELGVLSGGTTRSLATLRPVPPGTDGGVSLVGTAAGLGGALTMSGAAAVVGVVAWPTAPWIALGGVVATMLESLVGATLERRGWVDNEWVNLVNTNLGALLAAAGWWALSGAVSL